MVWHAGVDLRPCDDELLGLVAGAGFGGVADGDLAGVELAKYLSGFWGVVDGEDEAAGDVGELLGQPLEVLLAEHSLAVNAFGAPPSAGFTPGFCPIVIVF